MAAALLLHLGDGELRDVKEPGDVDAQDRHVVGLGVLGERFGDEDAGVVDERVDPPEPGHPFGDRTLGRLPIGDVAGNREDLIIVRRSDRARGRDDPVVAIAVRPDEGRADALRGTGNNSNFLVATHNRPPSSEDRGAKADRAAWYKVDLKTSSVDQCEKSPFTANRRDASILL